MSQRLIAAFTGMTLVAVLLAASVLLPLPYVTYKPGPTVDILAAPAGNEIVQVEGHEAYHDDGELRMTTVSVTRRDATVNLFELLDAWVDPDDAVYPYELQYPDEGTTEQDEVEGQMQMQSSQDTAIAVALRKLGIEYETALEVFGVVEGMPADGKLEQRDVLVAVDGKRIERSEDVTGAVDAAGPGTPITFTVRRDGEEREVRVTPEEVDGEPRIGITFGPGYEFPFDVEVAVDPAIGGPSAGLMFSLAIYDTLTPGSLTGGAAVAGTGEIREDGSVGPIGGIEQKIAGARSDGAELFLVPPDNCADALTAEPGDMRLVRAETMSDAVEAIEAWVDDPAADLPTCEEAA